MSIVAYSNPDLAQWAALEAKASAEVDALPCNTPRKLAIRFEAAEFSGAAHSARQDAIRDCGAAGDPARCAFRAADWCPRNAKGGSR